MNELRAGRQKEDLTKIQNQLFLMAGFIYQGLYFQNKGRLKGDLNKCVYKVVCTTFFKSLNSQCPAVKLLCTKLVNKIRGKFDSSFIFYFACAQILMAVNKNLKYFKRSLLG